MSEYQRGLNWKTVNEKQVSDRSVVFSGSSVSSTNKTDRHDIGEIVLKVALSTIKQKYISM
jgi:hypothetical protein